MAPQYLCNGIVMECESNSRLTRSCNSFNVSVPFARTKMYEKSFLFNGSIAWNRLPEQLKRISNIDEFKIEVKKHIFSEQM